MKSHRTDKRGFTLVEILIVLLLLSVLTAVVIANVTGMFGRGSNEAWKSDEKSIRQALVLFYFDMHRGASGVWGSESEGHYYPTADGQASANDLTALLAVAGSNPDYFDNGANGAIWMGLLVNSPEDGAIGNDAPDTAHPQGNEKGPYLNEVPESSSVANGNASPGGTYTWVICRDGRLYGLYWDGSAWKEGFSGTYP